MFDYEFQKHLLVTVASGLIYGIAMYALLDFAQVALKGIYALGKGLVDKLKALRERE